MADIPITLAMIVKDEEEFIESAILSAKSVMGFSDIVVADTGSSDKTKELAAALGARVFDFEWCDDFSAARNFAADKAINDRIFFLDADELVTDADMKEVLKLTKDENSVGIVTRIELSDNSSNMATRFYNRKTHTISGRVHENPEPLDGIKQVRALVPVVLNHRGYLPELWEEKGKYQRNVRLIEETLKEHPNDPYYLYQLGKCHFTGNRDLANACRCFEKVLSVCDDIHLEYIYKTVECYGYALINTGKYPEALNLLDVYYRHYRKNPEFRFLAAHIYENNAMFIEAVECYESCIGADMFDTKGITSFLSFYNIGVILECLEMFEDAIEMYKNCGDYQPALDRLKELNKPR